MKKLNWIIIYCLLFISSQNLFAQNNIDLNSLPSVADLIGAESNPSADTVIIGMHGGPTNTLYLGDFNFFNSVSTFSVVEVKQYKHYNSSVLANSATTLSEAIIYNDTCVAMLRKVVNHYNTLGKTVVLIGHSFGAFILAEYIDDYGVTDIHRIIPMAGRLNMNSTIWQNFANGYFGGFASNGTTVIIDNNQAPSSQWAAMKLMAGFGYNRWVDSLSTLNLSKMMYVFGTMDEAVGRLTPSEIAMLNSTSASILEIQGDHGSPFLTANMNQVLDFIRAGFLANNGQVKRPKANVKVYPTVVTNFLTIEVEKSGTLNIVSSTGQLVETMNYNPGTHQITLNHLPAGFYVVNYLTKDNEWANTKIIVK